MSTTTTAVPATASKTRRNLSRLSRRTVRAVAEVVLPCATPEAGGTPDATVVPVEEIVDFVDDWVRYLPRLLRVLFPIGLMLLELGAIVLRPLPPLPLSLMPPARRRRYVESWSHARSPIRRDLIKAIRGLCLFAYYSDPRVATTLGFKIDEHVALVSQERLTRHGHDLRRAG